MKIFVVRFVVLGSRISGAFPLDMLRYDGCYPADQESVGEIAESMDPAARHERSKDKPALDKPIFRVRMNSIVIRKDWRPTVARWASFGWQVEITSVRMEPL